MFETKYHDLKEFGLHLVPAGDLQFGSLVEDIRKRSQPVWFWPEGNLDPAAVLLNESGQAIIVLAYEWRYTTIEGRVRTSSHSNLGSSMQMDVLSGQAEVLRDLGSFILAGSKRLITENGVYGNNLDVLPEGFTRPSGGMEPEQVVSGITQGKKLPPWNLDWIWRSWRTVSAWGRMKAG